MNNDRNKSTEFETKLFPIRDLTSENLMAALNNLHERLHAFETAPRVDTSEGGATVLSPSDRAVLDHCAGFFGVHTVVAETLASQEAGVADIDPVTGKARVVVERPTISKQEPIFTGA